jgi:hypothetical protein
MEAEGRHLGPVWALLQLPVRLRLLGAASFSPALGRPPILAPSTWRPFWGAASPLAASGLTLRPYRRSI